MQQVHGGMLFNMSNEQFNRYPGQKLRASSGRKAPKIAGTWKQYSHRKLFGFFPTGSCRKAQQVDWNPPEKIQ